MKQEMNNKCRRRAVHARRGRHYGVVLRAMSMAFLPFLESELLLEQPLRNEFTHRNVGVETSLQLCLD